MIPDDIKQKIDTGEYTFIDKLINGGFGYGKVCIPDEVPQIILAVIFPPFSILWNWYLGIYSIWQTIYKFIVCLCSLFIKKKYVLICLQHFVIVFFKY